MFHRVDIWLRGLDLCYSVLKYRPTPLLNDEWSRGDAAIKLLTIIVHVICGVRLWGCGAEAFDLKCERVGVNFH